MFTHCGHNTITAINQHDHIMFSHMRSSAHPESLHHQIFHFLTAIKRHTDTVIYTECKFMNSNGLGKTKHITNIHKEFWEYFLNKIQRSENFDMELSSPNEIIVCDERITTIYHLHHRDSRLQ